MYSRIPPIDLSPLEGLRLPTTAALKAGLRPLYPPVGAGVRDKLQDQVGEVIGHTSERRPIVRWADGSERSRSADSLDVIGTP